MLAARRQISSRLRAGTFRFCRDKRRNLFTTRLRHYGYVAELTNRRSLVYHGTHVPRPIIAREFACALSECESIRYAPNKSSHAFRAVDTNVTNDGGNLELFSANERIGSNDVGFRNVFGHDESNDYDGGYYL